MKKIIISICLITLLLNLSACKQNGIGTVPSTPEAVTEDNETESDVADSAVVLPSFTLDTLPVIQANTACQPLAARLIREMTGCTEDEAYEHVEPAKTATAMYSLNGNDKTEPVLLLTYMNYEWDEYPQLERTAIGRDGLIFITNSDNPVDNLTTQQVFDIYTGAVTNWSQVGGADMPITAYQRQTTSGAGGMLDRLILYGAPLTEAPSDLVASEMGELVTAVASYKNIGGAIGYSVYYYANFMFNQPDFKMISIDGVAPSNQTIADGSYKHTENFFAVIRPTEAQDSPARAIIEWLKTAPGRKLIAEAGYVGVK